MKCLSSIALVVAAAFFPPAVFAQENQEAQIAYQYDCNKLPYTSLGCNSYNEMIRSNDSDVISALKTSADAYVCFNQEGDEFFIVSFDEPIDSTYAPVSNNRSLLQSPGAFSYSKYKDGVQNDSGFLFGKWSKVKGLSLAPSFVANDTGSQRDASVTENEISCENTFKNLNGTTTTFNLQIRRSTLRFNQTYTFPQPGPARKTAVGTTQPQSHDQVAEDGHCAEFK